MCLPYTRSLKSSSVVMSGQRFTLLMWTIAEKGFAECIHAADALNREVETGSGVRGLCSIVCGQSMSWSVYG